ncbi:protein Smaug [Anopheles aquasalis]|uniref:protein Smaug n=1 Tax=Anopheles aquasalis TaxID=42839 RepID=UPI00215AE860|nr:protein Smaug [Anopheles aquasalis]XP_050091312.1 protein Smaug [Anopheles aquasalis]
MKYPGGNPSTMFCEQVGTVTSLFEQWNDCERTVVLYALLKRVPFVNLKFLQVSIDYNLAQNYSTQSKLQQLEAKANDTTLLRSLVQRYYQLSGGHSNAAAASALLLGGGLHLNNNNNNTISVNNNNNNNLKTPASESSSVYELLKKTTSLVASHHTPGVNNLIPNESSSAKVGEGGAGESHARQPDTMEEILKDILMYLPLLAPGNDVAKSMYMSLIPGAVEDACRQLVPTEIVQQTLSYLLIHPAITNEDRRVLSHQLRHLEDFISTSYVPAVPQQNTGASAALGKNRNYMNLQSNGNGTNTHNNGPMSGSNAQVPFLPTKPAGGSTGAVTAPPWHPGVGITVPPPSTHSSTHSLTQLMPPSVASQHSHSSLVGPEPTKQSMVLSKSVTNQTNPTIPPIGGVGNNSNTGGSTINCSSSSSSSSSSTTSSSSCLDSGASQLLKSNLRQPTSDWSASTGTVEYGVVARGQQGNECGQRADNLPSAVANDFRSTIGKVMITSSQAMQQLQQSPPQPQQPQQQQNSGAGVGAGGGNAAPANDDLIAATESLLYDSTPDDHHVSFSKNGTEIFDYDCDFDHEDEFNYLARSSTSTADTRGSFGGSSSLSSNNTTSTGSATSTGKKLVSFNNNVSDYLCVPLMLNSYQQSHHHHGGNDLDLDGMLMKTRRSNSLTTPSSSSVLSVALGAPGELLHAQQKQNNECLSAENLTNLQLLQNKPRSFSLTMESPRSSLTSSGSDTQLDDFKHQGSGLMKLYGNGGHGNVGMSSIAHWLKSLRLHKYVWLFSNLTYDQMLGITEEYLQNLSVTKGARHKLALCIQKLNERYGTLRQLEKDLLSGPKIHLGAVLEELTNMVQTPMKPIGVDQREDVAGQFVKVLDLVASIVLRPISSPQDEEYLNIFQWIIDRALHNDAFVAHFAQIKDHKNKLLKLKMQLAPKAGHFSKSANTCGVPGGLNKPRWTVNNKHKPCGVVSEPQVKPHRKSSIPYFVPPGQAQVASAAMAQQYFHHSAGNNGGNGAANYNKSSSYPSFASSSGTLHGMKAMGPVPNNPSSMQQQQPHQPHQQNHAMQTSSVGSHVPHQSSSLQPPSAAMQHPNFMFHRHSLSNITPHSASSLAPPIFLSNLNSLSAENCSGGGKSDGGKMNSSSTMAGRTASFDGQAGMMAGKLNNDRCVKDFPAQGGDDGGSGNGSSLAHNNSIGDINTRLEFLCRQMTEQAIN